jgi:hypothetical protein
LGFGRVKGALSEEPVHVTTQKIKNKKGQSRSCKWLVPKQVRKSGTLFRHILTPDG